MTCATRSADPADDFERQILGGHARTKRTLNPNFHCLRRRQQQRLGRKDMLDFRRTDAERERAESAVTRRMAVSAHNGRSGQGEALFRADDVNNALLPVGRADIPDSEGRRILFKRGKLLRAFGIRDWQAISRSILARGCREIVIRHGQRQIRSANFAARHPQPFERLRAGDFMDEVTVDEDKAGAVRTLIDNMGVPDFFIQCARS